MNVSPTAENDDFIYEEGEGAVSIREDQPESEYIINISC